MPLADLSDFARTHRSAGHVKLEGRIVETVKETWHLGLTAFGGPPVHFQIFHKRFVEPRNDREPWLDEQTVRVPVSERSRMTDSI